MFLIHINDFPLHVDNSSVDLYVDDTTLYCSKMTVNEGNSSINKDLEHTKTFGVRSGFVMDKASNMDGNKVKRQGDAVTEMVKDDTG